MKLTTFTIILLSVVSVVMATLFIIKPRKVFIEVPVPQVINVPAKPDTVYVQKIKFVQISVKPDTEYVIVEDEAEPETIVSEKLFTAPSDFGPVHSLVKAYSLGPVKALSDSIYFPCAKDAMEKIKQEILEQNKPKSKFWTGVSVGALSVSTVYGIVFILTK